MTVRTATLWTSPTEFGIHPVATLPVATGVLVLLVDPYVPGERVDHLVRTRIDEQWVGRAMADIDEDVRVIAERLLTVHGFTGEYLFFRMPMTEMGRMEYGLKKVSG